MRGTRSMRRLPQPRSARGGLSCGEFARGTRILAISLLLVAGCAAPAAPAVSWNVVDDQTSDFKLRQGVKFHTGADLTAADVKASMDHLLDKSINAPSTGIVSSFKEMQIVDPQTVRLVLSRTDARVFDL